MDMCLLCLELKQESIEVIRVTSKQWQKEDIEKIIEQHFWTLRSITTNSWLCTDCWGIVNNFHKFYLHIEEAHSYFVSMLKVELLENNEDMEEIYINKDLTENNSPDIPRKKRLTTNNSSGEENTRKQQFNIKTEITDDEQPITVDVELLAKTRHKSGDPLEKPLPARNRRARRIVIKTKQETQQRISSKEAIAKETECTIEKNEVGTRENSQTPTDSEGDFNSSSSDMESDNQNQRRRTTTKASKPRPKRKEMNVFLDKHFKITCVICQQPMPTFHELSKHFSKQHYEQPAYVVCCDKKILTCTLLFDHIHCHLDPEYFKCKHCGKIMADRRCLEAHLKTHVIRDKTHVCDICQKGFSRMAGLRNHKQIHLSDEEKQFACKECGKLFGNKNVLTNHVRVVHMNKYALVCDICGEKMRSKEVLERHILKHKGLNMPAVACDICGLKITDQRGLKRHKDSQHPEGGKQDYPCHLCSKISPTLKAHKKHVKDKHESGYDFKCTLCEKAYKRSSNLKEHMTSHTGTALYTCSYCPKTFNSNSNMHSHRKNAHPKEWEDDCRAKYSGNLPEKYKIPNSKSKTLVTNEVENIADCILGIMPNYIM